MRTGMSAAVRRVWCGTNRTARGDAGNLCRFFATMEALNATSREMTMKVMTARDAKNHFGEFLDAAQREPVVITRNNRPVGIMISMQDAADMVLPEMMMDKEPGYDAWLLDKVTSTLRRVDSGETALIEHQDAMQQIRDHLKIGFSNTAA